MTKSNITLPQGWSSLPINEVFEFIGTSSFSRNDLNYEADENSIYNIHYGDIHATYKNAVLDFDTETRIPVLKDHIKPSTNFLKEGDLIIADASEDYEGVGEALELYNIRDKKVLAGLHTFALRDKNNKTAHGYRAYLFKNPEVKKRLKTIATGSKVYGISKGNLEKFKITLPPFPEQQKIAKILATWDKAIALQQKFISNKKENKKAVMKKLLTGEVRFKGFNKEWEDVKLGSIAKIGTGKKDNQNKIENGLFPFFVRSENIERINSYSFDGEAILVPGEGRIGEIFHYIDGKFDFHQRVYKISDFNKNVFGKYIFNYFQCFFAKEAKNNSVKATVDSLRLPTFKGMKIILPQYEEQKKISTFLSGIEKEINALQIELNALQKQKQGLMQQLLTGTIRVKN